MRSIACGIRNVSNNASLSITTHHCQRKLAQSFLRTRHFWQSPPWTGWLARAFVMQTSVARVLCDWCWAERWEEVLERIDFQHPTVRTFDEALAREDLCQALRFALMEQTQKDLGVLRHERIMAHKVGRVPRAEDGLPTIPSPFQCERVRKSATLAQKAVRLLVRDDRLLVEGAVWTVSREGTGSELERLLALIPAPDTAFLSTVLGRVPPQARTGRFATLREALKRRIAIVGRGLSPLAPPFHLRVPLWTDPASGFVLLLVPPSPCARSHVFDDHALSNAREHTSMGTLPGELPRTQQQQQHQHQRAVPIMSVPPFPQRKPLPMVASSPTVSPTITDVTSAVHLQSSGEVTRWGVLHNPMEEVDRTLRSMSEEEDAVSTDSSALFGGESSLDGTVPVELAPGEWVDSREMHKTPAVAESRPSRRRRLSRRDSWEEWDAVWDAQSSSLGDDDVFALCSYDGILRRSPGSVYIGVPSGVAPPALSTTAPNPLGPLISNFHSTPSRSKRERASE